MPRRQPKLCRHKGVDQGYVNLQGKVVYLGKWPKDQKQPPSEVERRYHEVLAGWNYRQVVCVKNRDRTVAATPTVRELLAAFERACAERRGVPSGGRATDRIRRAAAVANELYGDVPADRFGPLALEAVRARMADREWSRSFINDCVGLLKNAFRWAASREMLSVTTYHQLRTLRRLPPNTPGVKETPKVMPAPSQVVQATLSYFTSSVVRDMVTVQHLGCMRPSEVILMRPELIDTDGRLPDGTTFAGLWVYHAKSKLEYRGIPRLILLGLRAQEVLKPYLVRKAPGEYLFSPQEAEREYHARRKSKRVRKQGPSGTKRRPGLRYSGVSYNKAVRSACLRAGVTPFTPYQLRHARATEVRSLFSPDHARVVLGHSLPGMTGIYAEADYEKAAAVMRSIG